MAPVKKYDFQVYVLSILLEIMGIKLKDIHYNINN